MTKHYFEIPNSLNPAWIDTAREEISVVKQGKVLYNGAYFKFKGSPLPDGTAVVCDAGHNIYCYKKEDYELSSIESTIQNEELESDRIEKGIKEMQEAIEFNSSIQIPVRWVAGITNSEKEPLSVNGVKKNVNNATHIFLKEMYIKGRIRRVPGSFLCTTPSIKNKYKKMEQILTAPNGQEYSAKITCKGCLDIALR